MTDKEAIEALTDKDVVNPYLTLEALEIAIDALKERAERKTGKWIITARNGVLCSECKSGTRRMPMLFGNPMYKYCPFCGVKMEVDKSE